MGIRAGRVALSISFIVILALTAQRHFHAGDRSALNIHSINSIVNTFVPVYRVQNVMDVPNGRKRKTYGASAQARRDPQTEESNLSDQG